MNFFEKITGMDVKRKFNSYEARARKLPADYQEAWNTIKGKLWVHSDFTGRNMISILEGVLIMFEEKVADGLSAQEVLGDDIDGFCTALMEEEGSNTFRDKWRRQLNRNISKKLNK